MSSSRYTRCGHDSDRTGNKSGAALRRIEHEDQRRTGLCNVRRGNGRDSVLKLKPGRNLLKQEKQMTKKLALVLTLLSERWGELRGCARGDVADAIARAISAEVSSLDGIGPGVTGRLLHSRRGARSAHLELVLNCVERPVEKSCV